VTSRNESVDILRGIGIVAVVAGHAGTNIGIQVLPVYSFHMPLFFFVSGLLFSDEQETPALTTLRRLGKLLAASFVAFFLYDIILSAALRKFGYPVVPGKVMDFGKKLAWGGGFGAAQWFVGCYIFTILYFEMIHRRLFKYMSRLGTSSARLIFLVVYFVVAVGCIYASGAIYGHATDEERVAISRTYGVSVFIIRFIFSFFFYYLGTVIALIKKRTIKFYVLLFMSLYAIQSICYFNQNIYFSMQIMHFYNKYTPIITSVCGTLMCYIVAGGIHGSIFGNLFAVAGRRSLSIFLNHIVGFFVVNVIFVMLGMVEPSNIGSKHFRFMEWYTTPVYILGGLGYPICVSLLLDRLKKLPNRCLRSRQRASAAG